MPIISLPIESDGTTLVSQYPTFVERITGYFDKAQNADTLPLIKVFDANQTATLPTDPKFQFVPTHVKDGKSGGVIDIDLGRVLFLKGVVVEIGTFSGSTGSLYIVHD